MMTFQFTFIFYEIISQTYGHNAMHHLNQYIESWTRQIAIKIKALHEN
jgi:hypothetical protein